MTCVCLCVYNKIFCAHRIVHPIDSYRYRDRLNYIAMGFGSIRSHQNLFSFSRFDHTSKFNWNMIEVRSFYQQVVQQDLCGIKWSLNLCGFDQLGILNLVGWGQTTNLLRSNCEFRHSNSKQISWSLYGR